MTIPSYKIKFDGQDAADDIYENVIRLEIEEHLQKAGSFMFRLSISLQSSGEWSYLADDRFALFKKVTIAFGFQDGQATPYFEGYITQLAPHFDPQEELCYLEVRGLDPSCLMNLEERTTTWADQSHSDIASAIFSAYGITPEVQDASILYPSTGNVLVQRGTDIRFLKELAEKNGFDCYMRVDDSGQVKGYFQANALDHAPLQPLAILFEDRTNVQFIDLQINGVQALSTAGWHLSTADKNLETLEKTGYSETPLGQTSLQAAAQTKIEALCAPTAGASRRYPQDFAAIASTEAEQALQGRLDRAAWFVKAKGIVNSEAYDRVIHARDLVPVKGLGTRYSGIYLVSAVKVVIADGLFEQQIELLRNAWGVTGSEPFAGKA
jgi:phage protein D